MVTGYGNDSEINSRASSSCNGLRPTGVELALLFPLGGTTAFGMITCAVGALMENSAVGWTVFLGVSLETHLR